jgi:hypothetical protein
VLDDDVVLNEESDEGVAPDTVEVFAGARPLGPGILRVLLYLQGRGDGDLAYLNGYRFEVKSTHEFEVVSGSTLELGVLVYEKGDAATPVEQRPALCYREALTSL